MVESKAVIDVLSSKFMVGAILLRGRLPGATSFAPGLKSYSIPPVEISGLSSNSQLHISHVAFSSASFSHGVTFFY